MEKPIIIINGTGGSGKDTLVSFCGESKRVLNISAVDKVKEAAKILVGWNGEKDEKARKMLSDLKLLSVEYNDAPAKYILKKVDEFKESEEELMFTHIRESSEIRKLKEATGAKTLLVKNNRVAPIVTNVSDNDVENFEYDYIIGNNGTLEELKDKATEFVDKLCKT